VSDLLVLHRRALDDFGRRVAAVHPNQRHGRTPCAQWEVRQLVNHLVVELLWVPPLLAGATIAEVGNRFEGDHLGEEPFEMWEDVSEAGWAAFTAPGALERTVHLSYGDRRAAGYGWELTADLLVHAWDLARAIGGDETLDSELVRVVYDRTAPHVEELAASGYFDPPVPVSDDADLQTRLLALYGRSA
jgi:uncharacterized protein (TIGR03086 family)